MSTFQRDFITKRKNQDETQAGNSKSQPKKPKFVKKVPADHKSPDVVLNAVFPDAIIFKNILQFLKGANILSANFDFSKYGVILRALDASNVTFVDMVIPKDFFDYYFLKDEELTLGLDIESFLNNLSVSPNTSFRLIYDQKKDLLKLIFSEDKDGSVTKVQLLLMNISCDNALEIKLR